LIKKALTSEEKFKESKEKIDDFDMYIIDKLEEMRDKGRSKEDFQIERLI
jgi:hypothetical protein